MEEKVIARESVLIQVRSKIALVWRRRLSGCAGVRAGDAWRQKRKESSGVAGRRTSDRNADA